MDQISGLPEAIRHDILARLPDRDSARTSVLSKAWRETWSTFPILSICSDEHFKSEDVTVDNYHSKIDKVIDYVGRRLLRLRDLGLPIKEFKLIMDYVDHKCMAHHVDLWMKMAIESGGEVLHLQLRLPGRYGGRHSPDRFYDLPLSVIESKSLTKLVLMDQIRVNQAFLTHSVKLYSVLKLSYCSNLEELNIDARNLLSFAYEGNNQPGISFQQCSNQLEVNSFSDVDFQDLCSLRKFVQNIKPQKIWASVSLFICLSILTEPEQGAFQVSSIPPTIKRLELQFSPDYEAFYFPFMNYLLSSCCPNSISFSFRSYVHGKAFIQFLYETLMGRKEGKCHCSSSNTKCWWHALKIVKVICTFKIDENADFKTMLDALPTCCADENIGFILEL
ncbi:putative FBD-associated F-box protein At5g56410 isoform X2 [Arachis duranensis]|uniref:FBD-associated F-box protein At5g56410 isoform X2 n=1 Tax=Arachis duranensis TaxID=130453 RepID=A0A9C6TKD1_ARADU|nr:putative FBD-associated F-box protein At5g56410 isoform X2 [Arachis duranensis]